MAKDIYKINQELLKKKGLKLNPTGLMFTPYEIDTNEYYLSVSEWQELNILNKKTGKTNTINLVMQLLCDNDF